MYAPSITPKQLHAQDKRRRGWDEQEIGVTRYLTSIGRPVEGGWYGATNPPEREIETRREVTTALVRNTLLL